MLALVGSVEQLAQRRVAAQQRVDLEVVVRVVAMVRGRLEDRGHVDRVDAEILEVVEALDDPEQVAALEAVRGRRRVPRLHRTGLADAVAGGEPIREDLVERRVPNPVGRVDSSRAAGSSDPMRYSIAMSSRAFACVRLAAFSIVASACASADADGQPVGARADRRRRARPSSPARRPVPRSPRSSRPSRGGPTASSTRCSSEVSPTRTATVSATCAGSPSDSTTSTTATRPRTTISA